MTLLESINKENIVIPIKANGFTPIIKELLSTLKKSNNLDDFDIEELERLIIEREKKGSTLVQEGIAIPHAKFKGNKKTKVIIGVNNNGVNYNGEEVKLVFLVLTGEDKPSEHIQILSSIAKLCTNSSFLRNIYRATNPDEVYSLFFN